MTNNLIAKPVVKNQYWIVTDGKQKVGNVIADGTGFDVKIGNTITHYSSTRAISVKEKIEFVSNRKTINNPILPTFSQYPTGCAKLYNSVLDVKRKLHLYTKTKKSKCFHAAGWFAIKQGAEYTTMLAPKYIFIQRYKYFGPFMTKEEAEKVINSV